MPVALNWFTETRAAAPVGVNSLDCGVAAEPTFGPTLPPKVLQRATLQVEGCKMPSICELPQGSAPGKYEPCPIQTTSPE
jgi:hypothetical protein